MKDTDMLGTSALQIGPLTISGTVLTTWGLMLVIAVAAWLMSRRLRIDPAPVQTAVEGIVLAMRDAISALLPNHADRILPFIGTLWLFLILANLTGLVPGLNSPTGDLSATAALAILVFLSVHWYGVRINGLKSYLRHYLTPSPILLPFHIISEVSRTIALAIRLFGNMLSLEMAALLVLLVAGFLVPIPILMLHIVEALVQAYLFGMLALIYLASGIQSQKTKS